MTLGKLFKNIRPFVKPYKWLVVLTLTLTLVSSLAAQVNAVVLDSTVDSIDALLHDAGFAWSKAARILVTITIVLLGKEVIAALVTFGQRFFREQKSNGIMNIIESINVIKSFNRERVEGDKQLDLQNALTDNQMQTRKLSFIFDGLKTFVEQAGTVLIIILTAYLVLTDYPGMSIGKISRTMSSC